MTEKICIEKINESLDRYPNIKNVMGDVSKVTKIYNYPYKQDKKIDHEWNIFGILNSEDFSDELIDETKEKIKNTNGILELISFSQCLNHISFKKRILERINYLIEKLKEYYSSEQFKSGLMNSPFSFLSELEFANFCLDSKYEIIEIEPQLTSGKKLDLKVKIKDRLTLVEVITPRLKLSMLQKQVGFFPISAEIENNIKSEFEHHEIEINNIQEDFILVIDGDYAGIDEINMTSAINNFCKKAKNKNLSGIYLKKGNQFIFFNGTSD